jgi:hypothetical protein
MAIKPYYYKDKGWFNAKLWQPVKLKNPRDMEYANVWCDENKIFTITIDTTYYFTSDHDAILFKLKFG